MSLHAAAKPNCTADGAGQSIECSDACVKQCGEEVGKQKFHGVLKGKVRWVGKLGSPSNG